MTTLYIVVENERDMMRAFRRVMRHAPEKIVFVGRAPIYEAMARAARVKVEVRDDGTGAGEPEVGSAGAAQSANRSTGLPGIEQSAADHLPGAAGLLSDLRAGKSCCINGHRLTPDEHGVWITSPYGLDCGMWPNITAERIECFLRDMAQEKEYGPVP
jgi:hypothetical protein